MKVSVITVCYNSELTLEETIISVLNQTYPHIEHIIIDGLSTDGTMGIVDKYKDKLAYCLSEKDNGMYEAMNKGVRAATGDVIFFLNSDDAFYDEHVVEEVVALFLKYDTDLIYGDVVLYDRSTGKGKVKSHKDFDKIFFFDDCICQQAIFYRKDTFTTVGLFDEKYKIVGDYDWLLRAFLGSKVRSVHINRVIARFSLGGVCNNDQSAFRHREERERCRGVHFSDLEQKIFLSRAFRILVVYRPRMKKVYQMVLRLKAVHKDVVIGRDAI